MQEIREWWHDVSAAIMQPGRQAVAVIAANLAGWAWMVDPAVKTLGLIAAALLALIQWQTLRTRRLEREKLELEIAMLKDER